GPDRSLAAEPRRRWQVRLAERRGGESRQLRDGDQRRPREVRGEDGDVAPDHPERRGSGEADAGADARSAHCPLGVPRSDALQPQARHQLGAAAMPPVLTSILAFKQSLTGGAFEALSAGASDSLTIISFPDGSNAYVEEIWAGNSAHKMEVAVFSPRFGDNQFGLRMEHQFNPTLSGADGDPQLLLPRELDIPVYSADTLNVQVNGTASDNADVVMQLYYENIQGAGQRLATWEQVQPLIAQVNANSNQSRVLAVEVTVTPGATGNYGTAVALNTNDDRLQADFDYALLGYTVDNTSTSFGIKGPDTGFYRI